VTISLDTDFQRGKTLDGQNLSGQLSDWSIHDLLQIMKVTKKTGALQMEGDRRGRIHFKEGSVTGADLTGSRRTYVADDRAAVADVLYVLSSMTQGTFAVGSADGPSGEGWSVEEILSDVEKLGALEREVAGSGLIEATGIRLTEDRDEAITLEPEDWKIIVGLIQPFTFVHLESRFGRGGAIRLLHTLHRLEVIAPISSEDESEFLDRLAEGIASDSSEPTWLEVQQAARSTQDGQSDDSESPAITEHPVDEDLMPISVGPTEEDSSEVSALEGKHREPVPVLGVSADASTTLTDGVYDEIRRLRSKAAEK
jgi:hypothetical protein